MVPVSLYSPHLQVVSLRPSFSENVRNTTIIYYDLFVTSWGDIKFRSHIKGLWNEKPVSVSQQNLAAIVVDRDSKS